MSKRTELDLTTKEWQKKVDAEIDRLIEAGWLPIEALDLALQNVAKRRRKAYFNKNRG